MNKKDHVHKLKRQKFKSGSAMYFCCLPDCYFKINPALALGKKAICWRCGQEFILTEYAIRLAKPHCEACHKEKIEVKVSIEGQDHAIANEVNNEIPVMVPAVMRVETLADRLTKAIESANSREDEDI